MKDRKGLNSHVRKLKEIMLLLLISPIITKETIEPEQAPNRQAMRQKASNALKRAREVMINKYEKTKKIKVAEYKYGDHVPLFVPRNIRHATDRRGLACIVINK